MGFRSGSLALLASATIGSLLALAAGCGAVALRNGERAPDDGRALPTLIGSSSSFAALAYWRWFNQLAVREGIDTELEVMGSGASIAAFLNGQVQFAGTDSAPSAAEISVARRGMLAIPVTAGAIAIAYNQPGCELRLSRAQTVAVFEGRLRNFRQLGCGDQPIALLVRGDASGSTANLTASLAAFSPSWRHGPGAGREVRWPVGRAVKGSEAMAAALLATPGSLGFVEAAHIRAPLRAAALESRNGTYLKPTAAAARDALGEIGLDQRLLGSNPDPARGYPIVNLNWMLVPQRGLGERAEPLRTSLRYILSQAGQDDAELLGYVPLPPSLRERSLRQLERLRD